MNILFCGSGWYGLVEVIKRTLEQRQADSAMPPAQIIIWDRSQPLTEAVRDIHVLLPSNARIDADVITAGSALRLIQQPAAGIDGIDKDALAAARSRDLPVCNAPGSNHIAVAEATLLLILSLARRLPEARDAFQARTIGGPHGREISGKNLAVIGRGRTGTAVAERARCLGMNVTSIGSHATQAELHALLASADIVSLHCPLTDKTRGLIDATALAAMKPGALLINCARGPVIDRAAVESALIQGQLGGLGIDTPWTEPWNPNDAIYQRKDVLVLPHIAGSTDESFERIANLVCDNISRLCARQPLLHRVV